MLVFTPDGPEARVLLQTRRGSLIQDAFPDLITAAERLPHGLVLDGEVVVWDLEEGRLSFEGLQRRAAARALTAPAARMPAHYVAFDLPHLNIKGNPRESRDPKQLDQRELELELVAQVQTAAAWAAEIGGAGDLMLSAALHRFDDDLIPLRLVVSESAFQHGPVGPISRTPAQTTANLAALIADKREAVSTAYSLVADLLADMGAHQPHVLTPEGDIRVDRIDGPDRSALTGW
ncbi:hypothetical protein [Streptomyces sp. NPDC001568]|uniref:ATP-dependent DNA ligase n=1 Tax=Streptomyces sp. NPDC001568 TaxID=3364588 RepID=UPI00368739D9